MQGHFPPIVASLPYLKPELLVLQGLIFSHIVFTPSSFTTYPHPVVLWLMQGICVPLKGCRTLLANPVTTLLLTGRLELISAGEIQNSFPREGWRLPGCTIQTEEGDHMVTRLLLDRGCRGTMWAQHGTTWKDSELICAYLLYESCVFDVEEQET